MASQVCETLAFINDDDGVREMEEMEVMEINGALLMSLMEESPSEDSDDERLDSLIRSFEAEISGSKMGDHDSASQWMSNIEEDTEPWIIGQMEDSSISEYGMEWIDMDLMPFDDGSWCYGDEKNGVAMGQHPYNSFWQDTYEMQLTC